jgi:presenilin-like A22 family membrane protease
LAFWKVFGKNFLVHNITELLIYPGIAAVFVQILNFYTVFVLLILISIYDMWAVWHSGIMQKMAKYQMNELKVFSGFLVPYLTKVQREKIKLMKDKSKEKV